MNNYDIPERPLEPPGLWEEEMYDTIRYQRKNAFPGRPGNWGADGVEFVLKLLKEE